MMDLVGVLMVLLVYQISYEQRLLLGELEGVYWVRN